MTFNELSLVARLLDPVKDQPHVKVKAESKRRINVDCSARLNSLFFGDKDSVLISRKDIFAISRTEVELFTLSVLYWGFPKDYNGICTNALRSWTELTGLVRRVRNHRIMDGDYYSGLEQTMRDIDGINTSTFSKLFYFAKASIDGNDCVIMDSFVKRGIHKLTGDDFAILKESIVGANSYRVYPRYLSAISDLSRQIGVKAQNLEYALWLLGKQKNLVL